MEIQRGENKLCRAWEEITGEKRWRRNKFFNQKKQDEGEPGRGKADFPFFFFFILVLQFTAIR